jgi:hypothetical protein
MSTIAATTKTYRERLMSCQRMAAKLGARAPQLDEYSAETR